MMFYEIILYNNTKNIKGHKKNKIKKGIVNLETDIKKLDHELKQLKEIYKSMETNLKHFLNDKIFLLSLYLEYNYYFQLCKHYNKFEIVITYKTIHEINKDFINMAMKIKQILIKIIAFIENKANKKQLEYIKTIKKNKLKIIDY